MSIGVGTSATLPVENDSYCSELDVIALVQTTGAAGYDGTTVPTEVQVLGYMARRTGEIYGWMAAKVGTLAPGPAAYSVTVDTGTDAGLALNALLIQANAFGASADTLEASGASSQPAKSERVTELLTSFYAMKETIEASIEQYAGASFATSTHISDGSITEPPIVNRTRPELPFTDVTEW